MADQGKDDQTSVTFQAPASFVARVDKLAAGEMLTRAAWLRRAALRDVEASTRQEHAA